MSGKTQSQIFTSLFQIFRDAGFHVELKRETDNAFFVRVFSYYFNDEGSLIYDYENLGDDHKNSTDKERQFRAAYDSALGAIASAEEALGKSIVI